MSILYALTGQLVYMYITYVLYMYLFYLLYLLYSTVHSYNTLDLPYQETYNAPYNVP